MVDKEFKQRRVQRRLEIKLLSRNGCSHNGKNAGADHRANPKCCKRERPQRFLESRLRIFRIRDRLVDGLLREELIGECGDGGTPSRQAKNRVKRSARPLPNFRSGRTSGLSAWRLRGSS